jgi:hypothetical protein
MQKIIDADDELKVIVANDGSYNIFYVGPWGREAVGSDMSDIGLQGTISSAKRLARYPNTMSTLRENQLLARLFHALVQNLGLSRTTRELASLGLLVRTTNAGTTAQADPHNLPFHYDQIDTPPDQLAYSASRNLHHFKLNPAGDEIAFIMTASPGHLWNDKQSLGPVLHDFAVKRVFEIYRVDQGKVHLAWACELELPGDLGL